MGGQFHIEWPVVEEQGKHFKVGVGLYAEQGGNQQAEKQYAELNVELGKQDSYISGKVSKGNIEGRVAHSINKKISIGSNFLNTAQGSQATFELHSKFKDCTLSCGYDLLHRDQTDQGFNVSYLQTIAPKFALGCKCDHRVRQGTDINFLAQYKDVKGQHASREGNVVTVLAASSVLNVAYTKLLNPGVSLVSEFTFAPLPEGHPSGKPYFTSCSAGAQYLGNTYRYHCVLDSSGTITANLFQCTAMGPTMMLSGIMNHWTGKSSFGIGFKWTPAPPVPQQ